MSKIIVIGSVNMDLIALSDRLPIAGETITGTRFLTEPGGKGANQAYAAAKLGGEVAFFGRIGSDEFGASMRANLEAVGCDVSGLQTAAGASGIAVILVSNAGQNSIVVVPGANRLYLPSDVLADARGFAGAGFALLQLEIPIDSVIAAAREARRQGTRVILDPAPAPSSLSPELCRCVDILTPNESEAAQLVHGQAGTLSMHAAADAAAQLQRLGVKVVIIKLGERGCLVSEGGNTTLVPSPAVSAVDTTGAGDVFNAALAVACSEGAALLDACRFAVRAAALSVTRLGAQHGMPSRAEVDAFHEPESPGR
jgi:ribokinase